jgi:hypothetical protein
MNRIALTALRAVQHAYPAEFRRRFGAELTQTAVDRWRHDDVGAWQIVRTEIWDAARAAPVMRWESNMTKVVVLAVLTAAAIAAAAAGQLLLLIPIVLISAMGWYSWNRSQQPVAATKHTRRWAAWIVGGAVSISIAFAIPAIDGGELSAWWWSAMAIAGLAGITMLAAGLLLAINHRNTTAVELH